MACRPQRGREQGLGRLTGRLGQEPLGLRRGETELEQSLARQCARSVLAGGSP